MTTLGRQPSRGMSRKNLSARLHSPAFSHAVISELYVITLRSQPCARSPHQAMPLFLVSQRTYTHNQPIFVYSISLFPAVMTWCGQRVGGGLCFHPALISHQA